MLVTRLWRKRTCPSVPEADRDMLTAAVLSRRSDSWWWWLRCGGGCLNPFLGLPSLYPIPLWMMAPHLPPREAPAPTPR